MVSKITPKLRNFRKTLSEYAKNMQLFKILLTKERVNNKKTS